MEAGINRRTGQHLSLILSKSRFTFLTKSISSQHLTAFARYLLDAMADTALAKCDPPGGSFGRYVYECTTPLKETSSGSSVKVHNWFKSDVCVDSKKDELSSLTSAF